MKKTWESFYKNILNNNLIENGDKILLAVSGGPDSICMMHMFWRLSKKINIELLVINFDHNLRKESKKEAKAVKEFARKLEIKCLTKELDVKKYVKEKGISTETAGRELRYINLENAAKIHKCNKISTAHNANDNAETVLMWLLRGSGSFTGIPLKRKVSKKLEIIRPLLPIKRKEIENYVKKHKLPFFIDKSNFSYQYTRNKIRHTIIPLFEKLNPSAIEHIFTLSTIQAREDAYLEEISISFAKKCAKFEKNRILLDLTMFLRYNEAVRFRVLKIIIPDKKYNIPINLIMSKILSSDKKPYKLSSKWTFSIRSKKAVFEKIKK